RHLPRGFRRHAGAHLVGREELHVVERLPAFQHDVPQLAQRREISSRRAVEGTASAADARQCDRAVQARSALGRRSSMDEVRNEERKPTVAVDEAVVFSMRNQPLLEQGTTYDSLATAENLWAAIKVYASGGENALHSHAGEDHIFIVMQGKAVFTFGDGRTS